MRFLHGNQFYAYRSRSMGTFGGKADRATIKIYDAHNANVPLAEISDPDAQRDFIERAHAYGPDRHKRDLLMAAFISDHRLTSVQK